MLATMIVPITCTDPLTARSAGRTVSNAVARPREPAAALGGVGSATSAGGRRLRPVSILHGLRIHVAADPTTAWADR